jgi:hypothetical protein
MRRPRAIASTLPLHRSFAIDRAMWVRTVLTLHARCAAISLGLRPSASAPRMFLSVTVSGATLPSGFFASSALLELCIRSDICAYPSGASRSSIELRPVDSPRSRRRETDTSASPTAEASKVIASSDCTPMRRNILSACANRPFATSATAQHSSPIAADRVANRLFFSTDESKSRTCVVRTTEASRFPSSARYSAHCAPEIARSMP